MSEEYEVRFRYLPEHQQDYIMKEYLIEKDTYFDKFDNTEDGTDVDCNNISLSFHRNVVYLQQDEDDLIRLTHKQLQQLLIMVNKYYEKGEYGNL